MANDAKKGSTPAIVNPPSGKLGGNQPGPGPDLSQQAKQGTDPGDKGPGKKSGDFGKGNTDAPGQVHFQTQAPVIGAGGSKAGAAGANPIDLSVTVLPGRWSKKGPKPAGTKKTTIAGPTGNFHKHKENFAPSAKFGPARNAVGVSLDGSAGSPHTGTGPAIDLGTKNTAAVGGKTDGVAAGTDLSHQGAGNPSPNPPSHQGFSAVIPEGSGANNAFVSGNVNRPRPGPGSIGGAPKNLAGINGTTIRPKRCLGGC
ncbi:MAG: hypothetical protein ACLPKB_06770 [Xanthobacteraceae bacterium]